MSARPFRSFRQRAVATAAIGALALFGAAACTSNTFELEWRPRSGRIQEFPEIDRAAWWGIDEARTKLVGGQVPFLDRLLEALAAR